MQKPLVWLIGSADDACFASAVAWLAGRFDLRRFRNVDEAKQQGRPLTLPLHGIVFCSLRPGQFRPAEVESLHRTEPHARLTVLLGSWCEGEVRSGRTIAGVKRIYWHQWQGMLPAALGVGRDEQALPFLPRTATEADWLEATLGKADSSDRNLLVAVCTYRAATFAFLADALTSGGLRVAWQHPERALQAQGADVLLWDGWPTGQLATATDGSQIPQAMLLDFPRLEDRERAIKLGVSEIVSKPFQLSTLWNAVEAAASRSPAA